MIQQKIMSTIDGAIAKIVSDKPSGYYDDRCMEFHKELKSVFPEAEPWYVDSHILSMVYGRLWDRTGLVVSPSWSEPRRHKQMIQDMPDPDGDMLAALAGYSEGITS